MDVNTLAEKTGLAPKTIYRLRSLQNAASTDSIADIADAFGIQPAVLLMPVTQDNGSDDE